MAVLLSYLEHEASAAVTQERAPTALAQDEFGRRVEIEPR